MVVPSLLHLQGQGYGVDKGIPSLVLAAASVDDVLSISGFGICLALAFSEGASCVATLYLRAVLIMRRCRRRDAACARR